MIFFHYCFLKKNLLSTFGNSNLTHLTTNVIFSGQRFAILAMFFVISASQGPHASTTPTVRNYVMPQIINRPGVDGALQQTPSSLLIN